METCINKAKGWRILTGQHISIIIRRFYRLLRADVPDMPDLKTIYTRLASLFKTGPRKPNGDNGDSKGQNGNSGTPKDTPPNA